ncbi:MAG TPA: GerMN domain-containing protein [Acidimicrobiales bacterium]|nr:GerMN domain-containing protein [Acidimicrobiales bacterium]
MNLHLRTFGLFLLATVALGFAPASAMRQSDGETTQRTASVEVVVSVYFLRGEAIAVGAGRSVVAPAVLGGALEALLAGPNALEQRIEMGTAIPPGTTLLGVSITDRVAFVNLSGGFAAGGGTLSMRARLAQLVYTATQFPTVDGVRLMLDGVLVDVFSGEGLIVDHPLGRSAFEFGGEFATLAPAILPEAPRPGDRVSTPLRVWGSSNTFEAAAMLELVHVDGTELIPETPFMATSGTGTRGTFDVTVPSGVDRGGPAVLRLFERSAMDGSRVNIVEVLVIVESSTGGEFVPISPARLLDTRKGLGVRVGPGETVTLPVAGREGVPSSGAAAVALNVTVTEPTATGFITVFPTDEQRPGTSNLNVMPGRTVANMATVNLGRDGSVEFYNQSGHIHLVVDVLGWYTTETRPEAATFKPVGPTRVFDSRESRTTPLAPGETVELNMSHLGDGIAYALNITVDQPTSTGYITAWPTGEDRRETSNLNFAPGQTVANHAIIRTNNGSLSLFNGSEGSVHLLVDVFGTFDDDHQGARFKGVSPVRIVDTRNQGSPLVGGSTMAVPVDSYADAVALVLNVTTVDATSHGYLTAYPDGQNATVPYVSNLNYTPGVVVPNHVTVPLGPAGVRVYINAGQTHILVDLFGVYR